MCGNIQSSKYNTQAGNIDICKVCLPMMMSLDKLGLIYMIRMSKGDILNNIYNILLAYDDISTRNASIYILKLFGYTYQKIGSMYNISRARAEQIVNRCNQIIINKSRYD